MSVSAKTGISAHTLCWISHWRCPMWRLKGSTDFLSPPPCIFHGLLYGVTRLCKSLGQKSTGKKTKSIQIFQTCSSLKTRGLEFFFSHSFLYNPSVLQARTISLLCQENRSRYSHTVCLLWMKITEPVSHEEVSFCDLAKRGRWWISYPIPSLREQPQARQHPPLSTCKVCPHLWTLMLIQN